MRRARRVVRWKGAAELALMIHAYGRGCDIGPVRREMAAAAGRALDRLGEDEHEVYKLEFVDGMDVRMASDKSHMSKSSYYRRRGHLIREVARELEA